jgi:hypothetical protein
MIIENKYKNWYYELIENRKNRIVDSETYYEKHHIIPRCLGGNNSKENLIYLTPKEHFIAHLLLVKMYSGDAHYKMKHAFSMMFIKSIKNEKRTLKSCRLYNILRQDVAKKVGQANKGKIPWNKGLPRDESVKLAVSIANKGKIAWNKGLPRSEEDKEKMKTGIKNKNPNGRVSPTKGRKEPIFICEYCNKSVRGKGGYIRYHGDNCNMNPLNANRAKRETQFTTHNPSNIRMTCEYCNKNISMPNYKRCHGDNCKMKDEI